LELSKLSEDSSARVISNVKLNRTLTISNSPSNNSLNQDIEHTKKISTSTTNENNTPNNKHIVDNTQSTTQTTTSENKRSSLITKNLVVQRRKTIHDIINFDLINNLISSNDNSNKLNENTSISSSTSINSSNKTTNENQNNTKANKSTTSIINTKNLSNINSLDNLKIKTNKQKQAPAPPTFQSQKQPVIGHLPLSNNTSSSYTSSLSSSPSLCKQLHIVDSSTTSSSSSSTCYSITRELIKQGHVQFVNVN